MTETETRPQAAAEGEAATGSRRKLTEDQEREVTRLYSETETPVSEISKRFGIGESSVYRVAQRHGASLRGRTATAGSSSGGTKAASRGTGTGRRGRRPGSGAGAAASGTATGTGRRGRRPASEASGAASSSGTRAAPTNG